MAVDMFLEVNNRVGDKIAGEAQDKEFKGAIDILAWSWGASQSGSTHLGGGAGAGKANFQDLSFTKYVDKSSEDFLKAVATGEIFQEATLSIRKAGGNPLTYIQLHLENIIVSSVSTGGSGGEDRLTENVTFNFARFGYLYVPQKPTGAAGTKQRFGWDIAENKAFSVKG